MVETQSDEILRGAHTQDVALLVVGDPFGATLATHTDNPLRARNLGIPTRVIHDASIMNAVGACGSAAVQLWPDSLARLLHRHVAAGQLL
jgi:diphthine synthase